MKKNFNLDFFEEISEHNVNKLFAYIGKSLNENYDENYDEYYIDEDINKYILKNHFE